MIRSEATQPIRRTFVAELLFIFVLDITIVLTTLVVFFWINAARAHDDADWIRLQGLKNRMGEYCCGAQDCWPVEKSDFIAGPGGYIISRKAQGPREEHIPYSEAMPFSIDGRLWICRKQDGSRRCVFDRPPGV